ncbi:MAG: ATP-binding protein [Clostridiales bacterium]|nr:ATP-binding protein [Clostridiales bacterium]
MSSLYLFSGPCGSGKSTLADQFANRLVEDGRSLQVYVIHGDDFHKGFVETARRLGPYHPGFLYWPDILVFIWERMLASAEAALRRGLDVIMDYVVEDELAMVKELAEKYGATLYYIVLTAPEDILRQRLQRRGDPQLVERSLFLKAKLEQLTENKNHLLDTSKASPQQLAAELDIQRYHLPL